MPTHGGSGVRDGEGEPVSTIDASSGPDSDGDRDREYAPDSDPAAAFGHDSDPHTDRDREPDHVLDAGHGPEDNHDPNASHDPDASHDRWAHEFARINGLRFHYVAVGDPDGPLVVLLHGFPECWYVWHRQLDSLADAGYRVLAPDLRGYNRTDAPRGVEHYRIERLVDDVADLIARADRDTAAVVGHDWGGLIGWELAGRRPAVLDRLAVLNAPHPLAYRRALLTGGQLWRSWYVGLFQVPWLPERLLRWHDGALVDRRYRRTTVRSDALDPEEVHRFVAAVDDPVRARAAIDYYRAYARTTAREWLREALPWSRGPGPATARIDVPTLVIWGERDVALVPSLASGLDRWVPDVRVERLPGAGHLVQADAPERVTSLLIEFLRES